MGSTRLSGPVIAGGEYLSGWDLPNPGRRFFLNAGNANNGYRSGIAPGSNGNDGDSFERPWSTLAYAISQMRTFDRLFFVGDVREEAVVFPNTVFDIDIIGCGGRHHPDNPDATNYAYHTGAAMIRPPASPTTATNLLELRGRGVRFHNVHFDCPVDAAAVALNANALSGTSEYDASHAGFYNCTFQQGLYGIKDVGGVINVEIHGCVFRLFTPTGATAIISTSTSVRTPQYWSILDTLFPSNAASGGNECHIDTPLNGSVIRRCTFGTVEGTAKYIDLTGGTGNIVTENVLGGLYDTTDYVPGTGDLWYQNWTVVKATYSPDGTSIQVPGA